MATLQEQPLLRGGDGERKIKQRKTILAGVVGLSMLAVIGMASRTQNFGLSSSLLQARGEMLGATPKNAASRTQALDQAFDADKIYGQGPETDLDHPNRIDEYGCMFSNCADDAGAGGMLRKGENALCSRLSGHLECVEQGCWAQNPPIGFLRFRHLVRQGTHLVF